MLEGSAKIVSAMNTIFAKRFILVIWQSSEYTSGMLFERDAICKKEIIKKIL